MNHGDAASRVLLLPLHFQVGERTLASVRRRFVTRSFDLDNVLAASLPPLPPLPPEADGLILRSVTLAALPSIRAKARDMLVYVRQTYPRYYMRLDGGSDAYFAALSAKTRSTLKRKLRKFEELSGGQIDFREYRTAEDMAIFHRLARTVSVKTYQERLLGSGLPDTEKFRTEMFARAREGRVRAYLLFLNGEPISYLYTPIDDGRVIYAYLGYDPALSVHSPGTVLQLEAFSRLFGEQRHRLFDFTEGEGQHKRLFSTGKVECADVILLRPTIANRALIALHRHFHAAIEKIGDMAERHGIKSRIRRWLRSGQGDNGATSA